MFKTWLWQQNPNFILLCSLNIGALNNKRQTYVRRKFDEIGSCIAAKIGWGGRIRTSECQDQNLVPYHLATPQKFILLEKLLQKLSRLFLPMIDACQSSTDERHP